MEYTSLCDFCIQSKIPYFTNEPLKNHTSFCVGGPADILIMPQNKQTLLELLAFLKEMGQTPFVIGKGSNLLFSDKGHSGVVIVLSSNFSGCQLMEDGESIFALAGTPLSDLCEFAAEHNLQGLEFAYGIPGSVGGAIYMNAGAFDGEIKDVLARAEHVSPGLHPGCFEGTRLEMSYRHSVYSDTNYVITGGLFRLHHGNGEEIKARMDAIMQRRIEKQPLEYPSAGSTFKRPQGGYASALIDKCGLKGTRVGGAMVSEKHAGFLINYDNATSQDVRDLIALVQKEVAEKTGFHLECEVKIL